MTESPLRNLRSEVKCQPLRFISPGETTNRDFHKHLADKPVLVYRLALLAIGESGRLGPHLLDVLQHHVHVAIESLYAGEDLAPITDGNEDLGVAADGGLEDGLLGKECHVSPWLRVIERLKGHMYQRTGGELVLFEERNFIFTALEEQVSFVVRVERVS